MKKPIYKKSNVTATGSLYEDAEGREFTAEKVMKGFRPKKPYKLKSLSQKITSPDFGKVKK